MGAVTGTAWAVRGQSSSPGTAPDWVEEMAYGEWQPISLNTLDSVKPVPTPGGGTGHGAVIAAWNGAAYASGYSTHGGIIHFGGGHGDYLGNEVYAFDLATRRFVRLNDPYTGSMPFPIASGEFADGSPIPPHTYDTVSYHPATNSFVLLVVTTNNVTGGTGGVASVMKPKLCMFNLGTKVWDNATIQAPSVGFGAYGAYDSLRDNFWCHGINGSSSTALYRYTPSTKQYTQYVGPPVATDGGMAYDPVGDQMVYTSFNSSTAAYAFSPTSPTNRIVLTQVSRPSLGAGHGWEWSNKRQAFVCWRSGTTLYQMKHTSGTTWTWSTVATSTASPNNASNNSGPYSRFQIARWGDEEVALVCNGTTTPMYALRIPAP